MFDLGSIIQGVDSLFNGNSRASSARKAAEATARAATARAAADRAMAESAAKSSKSKAMMYGGIGLAAVVMGGMIYMKAK